MSSNNGFALVIEPQELEQHLENDNIVIVDLCKTEQYQLTHIPSAIHIDYRKIIAANPPVMGLLPDEEQLQDVTSMLGITPEKTVVAYDEEGGGKAARLLWTLNAIGHENVCLLNGGINAWVQEKRALESTPNYAHSEIDYPIKFNENVIANKEYILENLQNKSVALLDARSSYEYSGAKKFSERAGHIPGAVNMDWILLIDRDNHFKLTPTDSINSMLAELNISKDKEIIVYCQTHHRSALSYFVLKSLGFDKVKGYPGSWSEWGNLADTPVEL